MRPTVLSKSQALRDWHESQTVKRLRGLNVTLEHDEEDFLGVGPIERDWIIWETTNPEKPFWASPNSIDPDNPVTPSEAAERLAAAFEESEIIDDGHPSGIPLLKLNLGEAPKSFYGAYFASVEEAVTFALNNIDTKAAALPRDYNAPVRIDDR